MWLRVVKDSCRVVSIAIICGWLDVASWWYMESISLCSLLVEVDCIPKDTCLGLDLCLATVGCARIEVREKASCL